MFDKLLGIAGIGFAFFMLTKAFELMEHQNRQPAFMTFLIAGIIFLTSMFLINEEDK